MRKHAGFTLLELIVTVLIIGILAATAIPKYAEYVRKGKLSQLETLLKSTALPMKQHFVDAKTYDKAGSCAVPMPTNQFFTLTCATSNGGLDYLITADSKSGVGLGGISDYQYTMDKDMSFVTVKFNGATVNYAGFKLQ